MNITNGSVSIEDGLKAKEEYAPARKVRVDLSFTVDEGGDADATVKAAGDMAQAHVHRLIHTKAAPAAAHVAAHVPAAPVKDVQTTTVKPPSDKDKLAAAAGLPVEDPLNAVVAEPPKETAASKKARLAAEKAAQAPAKPADDNINDLLGETAPKVVTDAELGAAAQKKMEAMKEKAGWAPSKIRDLVKEIVKPEDGKVVQLKDVPQAARHDFLVCLAALT